MYYAATELEARVCRGFNTIVVGGGNSAGQAAIYMAQQGSPVSLVVRRRDARRRRCRSTSIARIEADDRIEVLQHTEVRGLAGDAHLEAGDARGQPDGRAANGAVPGPVLFHRRDPGDRVARRLRRCSTDPGSSSPIGRLPDAIASGPDFGGRDPLPFETSIPGVFAVGDVRSGSLKRVAAAVGEGSSAVRQVHEYLATHA